MAADADADDHYGPIDYVVVEFPDGRPAPGGFAALLDQVDRGAIRVLDLELVTKGPGGVRRVDPAILDDPVVTAFAGASSGLIDGDDVEFLGSHLHDGALAAVLVYEELSVLRVLAAWDAEGAVTVAEGHLSPSDVEAALDATEPS